MGGTGHSQVAGTHGVSGESQHIDSECKQLFLQEAEHLGKVKGQGL